MRDYELALVIDPDLTASNQKKLLTEFKTFIKNLEGKVVAEEKWGKKELGYPIKKKELGVYFFWQLSLPEDKPGELDKKLRVEEGILRFLLIKPAPIKIKKVKGGKRGPKVA